MGLIAREIESRGVPTTSLSSALDITRAVDPPRAAFVDYPLGHTAGKPLDREDQRRVVCGALGLLESAIAPSTVLDLGCRWSEDASWREHPLSSGSRAGDGRTARSPEPVYQTEEDRELALRLHGGAGCSCCVGAS